MVYQSNSNAYIAQLVQSALGTIAATNGAAKKIRTTGGSGMKISKAATESAEVRADGMSTRGRHGTNKSAATYNAELSLGSHDDVVEAIMRTTWDSVVLSAVAADFTTITVQANSITAAAGSWITKGFKVGDVVRAANFTDAANNNRNLRITSLTALVMGIAETLTINATPQGGAASVTRPGKRAINPAALLKRYFTIEEYEADVDQTVVLQDFVWGGFKLSMSPNGLLMVDQNGIGTGQAQALTAASAPYFTASTQNNNAPMSVVDATIRMGSDFVELTSFDLNMDIQPAAPDTFGSGGIKYAPDVFTGPLRVGMNFSMLRKDLTFFTGFLNETAYSLQVLCVDNTAEPKNFMSIYVPNFTLGDVDPSALSKQGGGRTQSISIPPALVGIDGSGGAFDATMIKFQSTAP